MCFLHARRAKEEANEKDQRWKRVRLLLLCSPSTTPETGAAGVLSTFGCCFASHPCARARSNRRPSRRSSRRMKRGRDKNRRAFSKVEGGTRAERILLVQSTTARFRFFPAAINFSKRSSRKLGPKTSPNCTPFHLEQLESYSLSSCFHPLASLKSLVGTLMLSEAFGTARRGPHAHALASSPSSEPSSAC